MDGQTDRQTTFQLIIVDIIVSTAITIHFMCEDFGIRLTSYEKN